ncbi:hypothetical protein TCAL_02887 [Tigriopus californicus]|uniref:RING-type E3 ubiquitin transferase n=1 Tax=Tigriopus californicus TaxID=6832 RepID=A0A553NY81_TIGCA|nr:hypothetical protein TCAL_02887 [Tigriopus californicus]|eukprot:TCALIF_02887-PA protein Name:"Similar to sinah Probable E3 ubiquitin-protein ligase sinah (Drosophila melanogaster)" AED:0.03 eAED:0.03 QI:228/0.8/0.83/1/1/1/6/159/442
MVSTRSIRMSNPRDSILQTSQSTSASLGSGPAAPEESIAVTRPSAPPPINPPHGSAGSSVGLVPRPSLPPTPESQEVGGGGTGPRAAGLRRSMPVRTSQHAPALKRPRRARPNSGPPTLAHESRSAPETVQISDEDEGSGSEPFDAAQAEVGSEPALVHVESWVGPMEPTHGFHGPAPGGSHGSEDVMDFYATPPGPTSPPSPMRPTTVMRDSGVQTSLPTFHSSLLPDDLKMHLECPVCSKVSLPPIMQCRNGHVTCNTCRSKVSACPVCREVVMDIRNMFAEKALLYMTIPCEYQNFGCKVEVQYREKDEHERLCMYRPYLCPYIECDHRLAASAVVEHVSTAHREECRRSEGPEITASMILIGLYFGEEEEAQDYIYEITAFKNNIKYVYGGEVSSLRTTDGDIVSEGQCLSISDAIGRRLRDGDKIRYKLKLMKKQDR